MKYIILFGLSIIQLMLAAQANNWENDKNITYLLEANVDFSLEETIEKSTLWYMPTWQRLKFDSDLICQGFSNLHEIFNKRLQNNIENGIWKIETIETGRPIDKKEALEYFHQLDTIFGINSEGISEEIILKNEFQAKGIRLKIQLAWNEKKNTLQSQILGLYPIIDKDNQLTPLFYISLPKIFSDQNFGYNTDQWLWVGNSDATLHLDEVQLIKGNSITSFREKILFQAIFEDMSIPSFPPDAICFTTPLSSTELGFLQHSIDTITVFDPNDYSETIIIRDNEITASDISELSLNIQFSINPNEKILHFRPLFLNTIRKEMDENLNIKYKAKLYTIPLN